MEENVNLTWQQGKWIDLVMKKGAKTPQLVLNIARNYAICLMLISISS